MFKQDELDEWLEKIGEHLQKQIPIFLIGGGALSFKGLKPVTKDIDIIVESKSNFYEFDAAIQKAGYNRETNLKEEFYLTALSVYKKGDSRIDLFLRKVGQMLTLTQGMISRAKHYKDYDKLSVYLVSNEDIFLFKAMTPRAVDILDCDRLMKEGLDYAVIYDEVVEQSTLEHKWFFWVYEKLCNIEDFNSIVTPLKGKLFRLVKENWQAIPTDFMWDVNNIERHIPEKKLLRELQKKRPKNKIK